MSLQLKVMDPNADKRWDDFVVKHPQGTIYHLSDWMDLLKTTYNYNFFNIALERSETGELAGVFPLIIVKSRLTGNRLVSLPFTTYCNPLIPEEELKNAIDFAIENYSDIHYVELKFLENSQFEMPDVFKKNSSYVTHILSINGSLEKLFKSFHGTSIRQRIKRAKRSNLQFRIADKEDELKIFYKLETAVRKKKGLPPQPYKFFTNMWMILKPKNLLFVPVVEFEGKIIAAAMVLKFKDTFYFEYSASNQNYLKLSPNQLLIWGIIKIASSTQIKYMDFGRSSLENRSLIEFKERWGAKKHQLSYYYYPKKKYNNTGSGVGRNSLEFCNRYLPNVLLRLQGKMIYPHLG